MKNNLYYQDEEIQESFRPKMLWRLLKSAGKHKNLLVGSILIELFLSFLSLVPSLLFSVIVGRVFPVNGALPQHYLSAAALCLGAFAVFLAINPISSYLEYLIPAKFGQRVCSEVRSEIFNRITSLSFRYFDTHTTGKILVRVTNYVDELSELFTDLFFIFLFFLNVIAFGLVWSFVLDPRVGAAVLLGFIPLAVAMAVLSKAIHRRAGKDRNKNSNYTAFVTENINGAEVVRAYNRGRLNGEISERLFDEYASAFMRTTRVREAFFPLAHGFSNAICTLIVYGVSLALILSGWGGEIALGTVVAIASILGEVTGSVGFLCENISKFSTLTTNIERIYDTIDTPAEITEHSNARTLSDCKGDVCFDKVNFAYQEGIPVLKNFTLSVNAGETVALVGATGSGKTTIVNLLSRFYDVTEGSVKIDGTDVRDYTLRSLREGVGAMMQDTYIFSGTVMENIRFSCPEATDEACVQAAKAACADAFIARLPEGYQTQISENYALSGGERQLLSFARLILADPKIIVLDEATGHVDTQTEKEVQNSLKRLLFGRTSFVIAHRLSTIREADKIVFIREGEIAEQGTHEELLQRNGEYAKMIRSAAV